MEAMFDKFASIISSISNVFEKIVKLISIIVLVVLMFVVFFQVASRIITGKSFPEIEEFSIIMAAWLGFFTVAYAAKKRVHVRIDVFVNKLPFSVISVIDILITVVTLYASTYLIKYGFLLAQKKIQVPMAILPINAGWWYIAFPIGFFFTSYFLFDHIIQSIKELLDKNKTTSKEGVV
jgi:TRAP-type C4-dicarboxylate transport system permease small subunit